MGVVGSSRSGCLTASSVATIPISSVSFKRVSFKRADQACLGDRLTARPSTLTFTGKGPKNDSKGQTRPR